MSICMGKKNTLLYLDETLVKEAKKSHLNISKITEDAIKHYLFSFLSTGEKASIDFGQYLATLKQEKRCYFFPFKLDELELKSIGTIDGLKILFDKFNVFIGNHGTGKTTIIRSIAYMLGYPEPNIERLLKSDEPEGEIRLNVISEGSLILKLKRGIDFEIIKEEKIGCIVLDNPGAEFGGENFKKLLYYLKRLNSQIVMTSTPKFNEYFDPDDKKIDMNIFLKKE